MQSIIIFTESVARMNKILEDFRTKLNRDECVYGIFMKTGDPMFVEAASLGGFDYVILDTEHGPVSIENQQNNIRAAEARGAVPIIRLKDSGENTVGKALDIGAYGIQVPQINSAKDAEKVVKFAKFYPYGMRGVCRFVRAADYSAMDRYEYFEDSKNLLIILQLEGVQAIENLDEILAVITSRPKPLALYLFTRSKAVEHKVIGGVSYGGGCVNDTIVHLSTTRMGFGGVGESGMGCYHGAESIRTFSHSKSILKKSNLMDLPLRYPPYKDHLKLVKKIMK